ncbi:MAG: hypothetical protein HY921_09470 [Elusimicrobia bacterium]|nr:hypothetical protein [Elusimicrobiota bacterium]
MDRLERRLGFIAVPGLPAFLAGMSAVVALLALLKPEFPAQLALDPGLLRSGQWWRVFTFALIPPASTPFWTFLWLMLYYGYTRMLEAAWGDFKFTLFCLAGLAGITAAALAISQEISDHYFHTSLFLAFARLNPEFQVLIFFAIPVRMKWVAAVIWALTGWDLLFADSSVRVALAGGLANYFLFFGADHWRGAKLAWRRWRKQNQFR